MVGNPHPATVCSNRVVQRMLPVFLLLLVSCGGSSNSSPPPPASPPPAAPSPAEIRTTQLDSALHPLQTTDPAGSLIDLAPLSRAAQARVVGMGEGTHGTRQFFRMKHRIFRWLVEQHGVRVFAMESDVAEGIYLDRYVQTGEGDLEAIMLARMHYWPWYTEEVRELIQWMADYNAGRPEQDRLRYIGVDSATVGLQPDLLIEYLTRTAPDLLDVAEQAVGPLRVSMTGAWELYADMDQGEYDALRNGLENLWDILQERRAELVDAGSETDVELHLYLLRNLLDSHAAMFMARNAPWIDQSYHRERSLANNVLRLEALTEPGIRVALWGHNLHVTTSPHGEGFPTMGSFLRETLGDEYQAIGFSWAHGQFMAQAPGVGLAMHTHPLPPLAGSINELLHSAREDQYILDLRALPASDLRTWLMQPRYFLQVGSVYQPELPPGAYYDLEAMLERYDVLIHIDRSEASRPLPVP
ncbi:erythromycin esterase family protein [Xanthomonadaceae bacterium XH05]|nr:erythromycin esterase family protein [Xanthomonadaceae bacterium XH05]